MQQNKRDGVARQVHHKDVITGQDKVQPSEYFSDVLMQSGQKLVMAAVLDGNASGPTANRPCLPSIKSRNDRAPSSKINLPNAIFNNLTINIGVDVHWSLHYMY